VKAASCSKGNARDALRALLSAGFVIAPRVPTNNMVAAYIDAYGTKPKTSHSMIRAIMKAKLRWSAMATEGCKIAASRKRMGQIEAEMLCCDSEIEGILR
jgi:hypothetical protein